MTSHDEGRERAERSAGDVRERLLDGLPVTERRLPLAGVETALLEGGDGPPVVLLHSAVEFAALWMRVIPDLVTTHRVVAPDLPGHGASGVVDGPLDTGRMTAWLSALIERTCPSPPVLVGHVLGGAVAARFASRHGGLVSGLALVDAQGLAPYEPAPSFGLAQSRFMEAPSAETRDGVFGQCFADLGRVRRELGGRWDAIGDYALDRFRTPGMQATLGSLVPAFGLPAIPPADLERIGVPTTLIWGRQDLQVLPEVAEAASARYGWPLHVIDGAGDDPAIERPEAFVRALRAALAAASGPAAPAGHEEATR